jgi:hypothetical protein
MEGYNPYQFNTNYSNDFYGVNSNNFSTAVDNNNLSTTSLGQIASLSNISSPNTVGSKSAQTFSSKISGTGTGASAASGGLDVGGPAMALSAGSDLLATIGNLYFAYQQNRLAKKAFRYNKNMMDKQYNMTLDEYNWKTKRADSLDRQLAGESYSQATQNALSYEDRAKANGIKV